MLLSLIITSVRVDALATPPSMTKLISTISWCVCVCVCVSHTVPLTLSPRQHGFEIMELTSDQVMDILCVLSGILFLGNLTFATAGGAQVSDKSGMQITVFLLIFLLKHDMIILFDLCPVLQAAADLIGVDAFSLGDALTQKFMKLRGEEITTPLTVDQVVQDIVHTALL